MMKRFAVNVFCGVVAIVVCLAAEAALAVIAAGLLAAASMFVGGGK